MKERLLEFIEYLDITNAAFEKKTGLSNGFINNLSDNIRETSIKKITNIYPDLDINWWKTGLGDMIKQKARNINNTGSNNINNNGGNVTISHNEFSSMMDLQKGYQEIQKELTKRLEITQNQLSKSQDQIDALIDVIKNK